MEQTLFSKTARYKPMALGRVSIWIGFTLLASPFLALSIGVLVLIVWSGEISPQAVAVVVVPLCAVLWNGYWFLFRISYEITFDGVHLTWQTPAQSGQMTIDEISSVQPFMFNSHRFHASPGQQPVMVLNQRGLRRFVDLIVEQRPDLPVRFGAAMHVIDRTPGNSRLTFLD